MRRPLEICNTQWRLAHTVQTLRQTADFSLGHVWTAPGYQVLTAAKAALVEAPISSRAGDAPRRGPPLGVDTILQRKTALAKYTREATAL